MTLTLQEFLEENNLTPVDMERLRLDVVKCEWPHDLLQCNCGGWQLKEKAVATD